jgi:iron complex outermembrane receptor protein
MGARGFDESGRDMSRAVSRSYRKDLRRVLLTLTFLAAVSPWQAAVAARDADAPEGENLADLSLEDLMKVKITSVSRSPEKLFEAPAAVRLITADDIRRSGASGIPGALEWAGHLDVAQKNAHEWIISARGFSSDVGNKLLVLMDGRTLYTPLFSGVFWDRQDYILDDLERIEVVRGPGGALWGANAVNGVINITTKSAKDTQGIYLEAGGGTNPQAFGAVRYGGTLAPDVYYRVYGKYTDRGSEELANGTDAHDSWHMAQGGFRIDHERGAEDKFTLQGDIYRNNEGIVTGGRATTSGGNVLGRWTRTFSQTSEAVLEVYYDRTDLSLPTPAAVFAPAGIFKDALDTIDVDFQHRFQIGERHHVVWGLGYRFTHDVVTNSPGLAFFPTTLNQDLFSGFLQDEMELRDNLHLTLGTKLEHNDYTGFEVEPSARLQWNPGDKHMVWAAISRAVRAPSRIDRDISQPAPGYLIVLLQGGSAFKSESVVAYELGYRTQFSADATASVALFFNDYDNLRSTTTSPPSPPFNLPFPFFFENNLDGHTYGIEFTTNVQLLDWWRLNATYRLLKEDIGIKPGKMDFNNALNETADPEHEIGLRSSMRLSQDVTFDTGLRWVDKRIINNAGVPNTVPAFVEMDARLGWDISGPLEFALVGQNLLHERHPEYGIPGPARVSIGRSFYGKIIWRM